MCFVIQIQGAKGQNVYTASQGPMKDTVNDFWRMLWEYDVNIAVMVCNEYEGGKVITYTSQINTSYSYTV